MPFTISHVLTAVPLASIKRGWLPFSALAIGCMIPDTPSLVLQAPSYPVTHSAAGIVTACWPLGLATFLLFHLVMKRPLFALLPRVIQERLVGLLNGGFKLSMGLLVRASLGVLAGAATHVFWDSFTHANRWGVQHLPWLNQVAIVIRGRAIPGYALAQHLCSLLGLLMLGVIFVVWIQRQPPQPLSEYRPLSPQIRMLTILLGLAIPSAIGLFHLLGFEPSRMQRLHRAVTSSGLTFMIVTLAYCICYQVMGRRMVQSV